MEEVEKVIKGLEEQIEKLEGKVNNIDKLGRKKLAYEIQKFRDGFYIVCDIDLPASKVAELKRYIKLNDSFLREMIFDAKNVNNKNAVA